MKIARDEIETYTESTISKQKDIANEVQPEPLFLWTSSILFIHYTAMPPPEKSSDKKIISCTNNVIMLCLRTFTPAVFAHPFCA